MNTIPSLRRSTSLKDSIQKLLNEQIAMEAHSSAAYLAMSAWAHTQGLAATGEFFRRQSEEERAHMLRIFDYVVRVGGRALSPAVEAVEADFQGLKDTLTQSLDMEIAITQSFNRITKACHEEGDFQTAKFVQWFLEEQMEEEDTARRALDLYELIGTEREAIFMLDQEIGKLGLEDEEEEVE